MKEISNNDQTLAFSYLSLRRTIGILGVLLPFVLSIGLMIFHQEGIQSSISYYYHTGMGDVFVGAVCVIGFFLLSYKGYDEVDDIAGNLAFCFAIGLALFPTHEDPGNTTWVGNVHIICAALFFLTLSYFSLCLFTKSKPNIKISKEKALRNEVFVVCGWLMIICVVLIGIIHIPALSEVLNILREYNPVFWLEAIAIVAFGISWLTKGEAILNDIT